MKPVMRGNWSDGKVGKRIVGKGTSTCKTAGAQKVLRVADSPYQNTERRERRSESAGADSDGAAVVRRTAALSARR